MTLKFGKRLLIINAKWAKSGIWYNTTDKGLTHTHIFSIFIETKEKRLSALSIIIGPVKILIAIV